MRSYKKVGLLIGLLAGPALIFLYLVTFTTNHYDVPYYFPEYGDNGEVQLNGKDTVYYKVPEHIGTLAPFRSNCDVTLVSFISDDCDDDCRRQIMNFGIVQETVDEFEKNCFVVFRNEGKDELEFSPTVKNIIKVDSTEQQDLRKAFKLDSEEAQDANVVLLDQEGRIRGFFRIHEKIELDRLFAEVKIVNRNLNL